MRIVHIALAALLALTGPASAQSVGLLIGNEDYDNLDDVRRGDRVADAAEDLEDAGFRIIRLADADAETTAQALVEFGQMTGASETLLVALSGQFLHSPTETFFLATDGEAGPLATMPTTALPLSTVMAWLSSRPGQAILLLGHEEDDTEYGGLLTAGPGTLDIPQGVTVLSGRPGELADFLGDRLAETGRPFVDAARRTGLSVAGYAPATLALARPPTVTAPREDDRAADIRDWRDADRRNTAEAYEAYIRAHPEGEFVAMAESRLAAMTETPEARAERGETALSLNRDARREIQRDLSLLGYNTRGIDGIFGPGTRGAVTAWQGDEGFEETGFLNAEQISLLDEQAGRRAAELEAEAEARRQERLAEDRAYWDRTGAAGDEAGLRAYLDRYPDGEFAEDAQAQLDRIVAEKRAETSRIDRQLWDEAQSQDSVQSYEDYLATSPDGAFHDEARARIEALRREDEFAEAAADEAALGLSAGTRRVIEGRLQSLGLRPGPVDGRFDEDTRRAIRRYQQARDMEETGYLSEAVVVQLLADTVRQIFR